MEWIASGYQHKGYYYVLDEQGNAVEVEDVIEWAEKLEEQRRVALDEIDYFGRTLTISTVFLGINHNWHVNGGEPVLFETMLFMDCEPFVDILGMTHTVQDLEETPYGQQRYHTLEEAKREHHKLTTYLASFAVARRLFDSIEEKETT